MPGVFISYRRDDGGGYAGRLFDILSAHFGRENTYMDLDTIEAGGDFAAVIEDKVGVCDVLLAVIGKRWLTITGEDGKRRLDNPGDFVRLEIAKALERKILVIPVLVGGAALPRQDELPVDLHLLSGRQAVELTDANFHGDVDRLVIVLKKALHGIANRPWKVKSNRFTLAALSVVLLIAAAAGILVFRQTRLFRARPDPVTSKMTLVNVAGTWEANVKYEWGDAYVETFHFEVDGRELSGTASFLGKGGERGIWDGKIQGARVSFVTKSLSTVDDRTYEEKHYYKGTVEGGAIHFSMLTDGGIESHVPIHFTATRIGTK